MTEKKEKKKDPMEEAMEQLEEYEEGVPPRKHESCCAHDKEEK